MINKYIFKNTFNFFFLQMEILLLKIIFICRLPLPPHLMPTRSSMPLSQHVVLTLVSSLIAAADCESGRELTRPRVPRQGNPALCQTHQSHDQRHVT